MIKKTYLINYESEKFQALSSDGVSYVLFFESVYFGKIKRFHQEKFKILYNQNSLIFFKRWDKIIENKKPLK